ncbi:MAG TPA: hydrogenase/urease maturation nickel metallochaperone HypA [Aggregatilineales bacterium]|nr:hydrogenase maturation nickel metallochaperone HypA [Chloroflexota bacterium]HOA23564.1 hydrogenase/urease maturation nickel metallochaperone HypA [Aggregatilineales bacterium]HPV08801.1 hydrogenase/urease maturation nickel metallochaperone HypA [Aggregatilineales bacterium]HQA67250.1 hydrogenase/urease maturation nickel metallochaperone HypA [Aggregatilineales bacterium]HQE19233.1 hydrogenase/urease maturation nickel metallochaperone HypA [Aggregatilineales bacterium]
MVDHLERMRAIVAQAVAEARRAANGSGARLTAIDLVAYGETDPAVVAHLFAEASRGTEAEGAVVAVTQAGSRYICWNCCGLRFESDDGICPNCGEDALEIPEEIGFGLGRVTVSG